MKAILRSIVIWLLCLTINACSLSNKIPPPAEKTDAPPTLTNNAAMCHGGIADTRQVIIPKLPKPAVNIRYTDPALGATVVRITNSKQGEVQKPAYSTMQAWNADESLLLLYRSSHRNTGHELRNGHTYEFIRQLNITPADIEEIFWSHSNPEELFYVSSDNQDFGNFRKLNTTTGQSELITDFSMWCGASIPLSGSDVHMQSYDDDHFAFRCQSTTGENIAFSYQVSTNDVLIYKSDNTGYQPLETAPAATPGGNQFWHQGKILSTTTMYQDIRPDIHSPNEHSSIGKTKKGQDALYQVAFNRSPDGCDGDPDNGVGHLVQHNLETGECRNIISQQLGYPYPTSSTHMSALAVSHPGRVALSSIGTCDQTVFFNNNTPAPPLLSEVYLAETNPNHPLVCRLAHHRSFGKSASNGGYTPYLGEPHATISPSGTRIIFGSDWYDSGAVDSFVIELPDYTKP